MDPKADAAYGRLRTLLSVNEAQIDRELIMLPALQQEVNEWTAHAQYTQSMAEHALDVAVAEYATEQRLQGAKVTENSINVGKWLDAGVTAANHALIQATHDYALWRGLSQAMKTKGDTLEGLGRLINTGYWAPNRVVRQTPVTNIAGRRFEAKT